MGKINRDAKDIPNQSDWTDEPRQFAVTILMGDGKAGIQHLGVFLIMARSQTEAVSEAFRVWFLNEGVNLSGRSSYRETMRWVVTEEQVL